MADEKQWLRANWSTLAALLIVFGLALFMRTYFVYGAAIPDRLYSGGSDSFYHDAIIRYAFQNGHQLTFDPGLNYPLGLTNPRPPLFHWWALLSGYVISPAFPTPWDAITWSFILTTAFFGSLTIFPLYALVKDAFDRRAGLIAAFLLAISPGHLQRSVASNADHDAFVLFFVVSGYFFFFRALTTMNEKRWVERWRTLSAIRAGITLFFRENPTSVLYSLMAAFCIGAVALTWQGWAYAPIILLIYFVFQLFFHRIRNKDTLGITIAFAITMGVALLISFPWYVEMNQVKVWFDVPAYLFAAAIGLAFLFTVTRDYPWALVLPTVIGASSIALGIGILVNPSFANAFVSGAGYFVQTKLYETIAEAQAPPLSQIILSFGWGTYFLSWGAVGYLLWQFVSGKRTETAYLFFVVWTLAAIIMAQAAARFIFNASPAFAASAGFAIGLIIQRLDYDGLKRTYLSVAAGSRRAAIRKSVKPRHVVGAIIIVFVFLVPNVWYAVDAAIPFEDKYAYDRQIYDLTPEFLRPANYNSLTNGRNPFYLGAFGFSLPHTKEYYPAAWEWFATQDTDVDFSQRPAFLSWWDYGFEAVDKGAHPTVADNFQNGYHLAGNAISAQSENEAIALLSLRLIEGDFWGHGRSLSGPVRSALLASGIDPDGVQSAFRSPDALIPLVKGNPVRYGYYDDKMQATNALYIYAGDLLTSKLSTDRQADLYRAIREATGKSIRYFAVDSRLFPSSASNTAIFYAPIKLSDHRVVNARDGRILPIDFFRINVTVGTREIPLQNLAEFDRPTNAAGTIEYRPMFYHSFFYRVYAGFEPKEVGAAKDDGIPGLSGQTAQALVPLPGWNLAHWRTVYRTAYYNPFADTPNHTTAWRAVNYFDAARLQANITAGKATGVVDLSAGAVYSQGVVFAKYYDGAFVNGTVTIGGRTPVPGVHITVTDELGVPHYEATTDAQGRYSVLAPFGEVTLTASIGGVNPRTRVGTTTLQTTTIMVSDDAAMRRNVDVDGNLVPDWLITWNVPLPASTVSGRVFLDMDANGQFDAAQDRTLPGASLVVLSRDLGVRNTTTADAKGRYEFRDLHPGTAYFNVTVEGRTIPAPSKDIPASASSLDIPVIGLTINGGVKDSHGNALPNADVVVVDKTNGTTIRTRADSGGAYSVRGLLGGMFDVTATSGDFATLPAILTIGPLGRLGFNLTAYPSGTLTGTTFVGGNVRGHVTTDFTNLADRSLTRSITSDASGDYAAILPVGHWTVTGRHYESTRLFAVLSSADVTQGRTTTFNPQFVDGAEVRGTAYSGTLSNITRGASVTFRSLDTGEINLARTSNFGVYIVWIPQGTYDVQAVLGTNVFQDRRTFTAPTTLDLSLRFRPVFSGITYRDMNRDGIREADENVAGARVSFTDPTGRILTVVTGTNGTFAAPLDPVTSYAMIVDAAGFVPRSSGPATPASLTTPTAIPIVARNITVTGSLQSEGSLLTGSAISILFLAAGGGAQTRDTFVSGQGSYSVSLAPGDYQVIVDENVSANSDAERWQTKGEDRLTLEVGVGSVAHDVDIVRRTKVTGSVTFLGNLVSVSVLFDGPESLVVDAANGHLRTYLTPGSYTVYANRTQGSETFLFAGTVSVAGPLDLPIALVRGTQVSGRVTVNGAVFPDPVPVVFTRGQGGTFRALSEPTGTYRLAVPDGDFTVSVDERTTQTISSVLRYVRVRFSGSLGVPADSTAVPFDVPATRALDNTTVQGRTTIGGAGAAASISFSGRGAGAINATASASLDGTYSVALQPGSYNVHAVSSGLGSAFLGTLTVSPSQDTTLNLSLVPAFTVSGVTTYKGEVRVSADLTFSGPGDVRMRSDAMGAFQLVLPPSAYSVTARVSEVENGLAVEYLKSTELVLTGRPDPLNLALERVARRGVTLAWDSFQQLTVPAGAEVTYTISLTNTGNLEETYGFSGAPATWKFSFRPSQAQVGFGTGGKTASIEVTITTPKDALVDHPDVTVTARSTADTATTGSVTVKVGIFPRRDLSLVVSSAVPTFDGRLLNYTLTLSNGGNVRETVALTIPGINELAARGWIARFAPPTGGERLTEIRNFSVDGNATRSVTIVFETTGGGTGTMATVTVFAENLQTLGSSVTFPLSLPQLEGDGRIGASGPNIVITQDLPFPLLAVLITLLACVSAGVLLTKRRRR